MYYDIGDEDYITDNSYPYISKSYTFDTNTGIYKLSNPLKIDPMSLDYSNEDYYFCSFGYTVSAAGNMSVFSNTCCDKLKKIVKTEKSKYNYVLNDKTYYISKYTFTVNLLDKVENESDKSDRGLYVADDDYGKSYYYRGNVSNNNVYFVGMYWQVVRINGDVLTITNILSNGISSDVKKIVDNFYEDYLTNYSSYISNTGFCGDRSLYSGDGLSTTSATLYGAYESLYNNKKPTLKCPDVEHDFYTTSGSGMGNKDLPYPIALISADELAMAGIVAGESNTLCFLTRNNDYFTMTPYGFDAGGNAPLQNKLTADGKFYQWSFGNSYAVNPVINLKADVEISGGIGTINDPYTIKEKS